MYEPCGEVIKAASKNNKQIKIHLQKEHGIVEAKHDAADPKNIMKKTKSSLRIKNKTFSFRENTARFLAKKYLPFSFFDDPITENWLGSYVSEFNAAAKDKKVIQLVSRNTIVQDTINMAALFQKQLKFHFASQGVGKPSIGLDCWTAPNRDSYFGVSASWIDEDWILRRGVIGMEYFDPPHTGKRMADLLQQILKEYNLEIGSIMTIVCDNASNNKTMIDALEATGFESDRRLRCVLHVFNLAAKAALKVFERPRISIIANVSQNYVESDDEEDGLENVKDINEDYVEEILENISDSYLPSVDNCRKLVRKIRKSTLIEKELRALCITNDVNYTSLVKDMPVRWNSTYDMIM